MWLRLWRKLFPPVEVHVQVSLPEWVNKYPEYAKENEKLRRILFDFHTAYQQMMKTGSQHNFASLFYLPAKEAAETLNIPLWKNVTPPNRNIL